MRNILFCDHAFHQRTGSSEFFREFLAQHFEVETIYIDPDDSVDLSTILTGRRIDLVILWQLDHLAPLFLAQGLRTAVVPMYDGSGLRSDLHWLASRQAIFINFSRRLHDRLRRLGNRSHLVKYFLPPVPARQKTTFEHLRAFLWQRRPEEGINLHMVERLFGDQLSEIHVHDAPDQASLDTSGYIVPTRNDYTLSVSKWASNPHGYQAALSNANVFVCPRRSEGIGMAMLEALARGMCVVAADAPIHDEYIANWVNGVLFNPDNVSYAFFGEAPRLGELAWRTAADGHARWLLSRPQIVDYLKNAPQPRLTSGVDLEKHALGLPRAHSLGAKAYETYLLHNSKIVGEFAGLSLAGRLSEDGRLLPPSANQRISVGPKEEPLPVLEHYVIPIAAADSHRWVVDGQLLIKDGIGWIIGHSVTLGFRTDPAAVCNVSVSCRKPAALAERLQLMVSFNGYTVGSVDVDDEGCRFEFEIPPHIVRVRNRLQLQASSVGYVGEVQSYCSVGLTELAVA